MRNNFASLHLDLDIFKAAGPGSEESFKRVAGTSSGVTKSCHGNDR